MLHLDLTMCDLRIIGNFNHNTEIWSITFHDSMTGHYHTLHETDVKVVGSLIYIALTGDDGEMLPYHLAVVEKLLTELPADLTPVP